VAHAGPPRPDADLAASFALENHLVRLVVRESSPLTGLTDDEAVAEMGVDAADLDVLQIERDGESYLATSTDRQLEAGDLLTVRTTLQVANRVATAYGLRHRHRDEVSVTHEAEDPGDLDAAVRAESAPPSLDPRTPVAAGILVAVIAVAALGLLPIVIAALGGVVAMIVTGCLKPADAYDAVSWNVVFLLAGVLPLGLAMQRTGGDALLASLLAGSAGVLPLLGVLALVYLLSALLANVITPVATVVLMIPVAVDAATRIGATRLTFLLAAMFAASTAFITPIGYQTNLMVYGPGGYRFTDYPDHPVVRQSVGHRVRGEVVPDGVEELDRPLCVRGHEAVPHRGRVERPAGRTADADETVVVVPLAEQALQGARGEGRVAPAALTGDGDRGRGVAVVGSGVATLTHTSCCSRRRRACRRR
jgi:hypothetical protein